jgi:hypothetical protein
MGEYILDHRSTADGFRDRERILRFAGIFSILADATGMGFSNARH